MKMKLIVIALLVMATGCNVQPSQIQQAADACKVLDAIADWVNENRRLRARVQQLLEANNREVELRREAERRVQNSSLLELFKDGFAKEPVVELGILARSAFADAEAHNFSYEERARYTGERIISFLLKAKK